LEHVGVESLHQYVEGTDKSVSKKSRINLQSELFVFLHVSAAPWIIPMISDEDPSIDEAPVQ
jgi:hypothetical protein